MKLIIDIDEEEYKFLKTSPYPSNIFNVTSAITNGTPIPDDATVCDIEQIRAEVKKMDTLITRSEVLEVIDKCMGENK